MYSLDDQIKIMNELGYVFNRNINKGSILDLFQSTFTGNVMGTIEEQFLGVQADRFVNNKPFHLLYYYLGRWNNNAQNITDNCLTWELDLFDGDGKIEYVDFMKHMGRISKGELSFSDINCFYEDGNRILTFTVNKKNKRWNLGNANYIPDSYILRFAYLCDELQTKGKYTIYDGDGEIVFVLDYATEEEQKKFNEVTKLGRIWLKDGNHFSKK